MRMRRQYAALTPMMTYNLTVIHTTTQATAEVARFEDKRIQAESVLHQFNTVSQELKEVQAKADLIQWIDSNIDVAAALAEMSHVIGETVVLSRVEFIAEALPGDDQRRNRNGSGTRAANRSKRSGEGKLLGDARFKILLAGRAACPADVAALVCRLEDSAYFRGVYPSFSRNGNVRVPTQTTRTDSNPQSKGRTTPRTETIETTEFEITCYLANFEEVGGR